MPMPVITTSVVLPYLAGEDWATVRLVPAWKRPLNDGDFVVFKGHGAHWRAELFASQVIIARYGRAVDWYEVNPWDYSCDMRAVIKGGGRVIEDVWFIKG